MRAQRESPSTTAAKIAALLGQECGIPAGSSWYPGYARAVAREIKGGATVAQLLTSGRVELGLTQAKKKGTELPG